MKRSLMIFFGFVLIFISRQLSAHELRLNVERSPPVIILRVSYPGDQPLTSGKVTVKGPSESRAEFQKGWTDIRGTFAFLPDQAGSWTLMADDGLGHREGIRIEITEQFLKGEENKDLITSPDAPSTGATASLNMPLAMRIIFGLSLIFGATGIFYGIKSKKRI